MAELVDARNLKFLDVYHAGSTPVRATKRNNLLPEEDCMDKKIVDENIDALKKAMTAAVSDKLMTRFLGAQYSATDAVLLAASSVSVASMSDPETMHGSFMRLVSKALCVSATDKVIDMAYKVITPAGEIQDAETLEAAQKELDSVFNTLTSSLQDVTQDVSRFSTQSERVIVASVTDTDNTDKAVVVVKGDGESQHVNIPANHIICDRCHNPGKKSKSKVLSLTHKELMPKEIQDLDGKMLCPNCLRYVNGVTSSIIMAEKARLKAEEEKKAADERDEQVKKQLAELEAEEHRLTAELEELEKALTVVPEVLKDVTASKVEECRLSIQGVRTKIESLTGNTSPIPMGPAKQQVAPTVVRTLTKAERRAMRRAVAGK